MSPVKHSNAVLKLTDIEKLRVIRKRHRWRQVDLANQLGVKVRTLRSWEQGKASPSNPAPITEFVRRFS